MLSLSLSDLQPVGNEPRIKDLVLAERLGFTRARKIRDLVQANEPELATYGSLAPIQGKSRGQTYVEFWLNEPQALLLCMFSRTEAAAAVRRQLIDVFTTWRRIEAGKAPEGAALGWTPIHMSKVTREEAFSITQSAHEDHYEVKAVVDSAMAMWLVEIFAGRD